MTKARKIPPEKSDIETDDEVLALVKEQIRTAEANARGDSRRVSATWVATGNSLALLVCNAILPHKPRTLIYRCRVLDCLVGE